MNQNEFYLSAQGAGTYALSQNTECTDSTGLSSSKRGILSLDMFPGSCICLF